MDIENAFAKALGRAPSSRERERLLRMRDAFGLSDNDALWVVAMLFESYDAAFLQYPAKCAEAFRREMRDWLASAEGSASKLTPPGREGAHSPALNAARQQLTDSQRQLQWLTLGGLGAVCLLVFGAVCMALGARLSGGYPCWTPRTVQQSIAANLLLAPMGWLSLLAVFVPCAYGAAWGWRRGCDRSKGSRERVTGWAAFAATTLGLVGSLAILVTLPQ